MHGVSDLPALRPPETEDANRWCFAPPDDGLVGYLEDRFGPECDWRVTRLCGAAYAYRAASGTTLVAKFYSTKTKVFPEHFALREQKAVERARRVLGSAAVEVIDQFRGVLLMPYVAGLSLQSAIAIRRERPGSLAAELASLAKLLARLHTATAQTETMADCSLAAAYGLKMVQNLAHSGVLAGDPLTRHALEELLSRWAEQRYMQDFVPVYVHGDVTTGNFLFPSEGHVVALDWERAQVADPAQDLGRLAAELTDGILQHGGDVAEALRYIDDFTAAYCAAVKAAWSAAALRQRARFYRAISSLRIARNAWSPGVQKARLVAHALSLLATA